MAVFSSSKCLNEGRFCLHNCITGAPYEMTGQTLQSARVSFVNREHLMRVLRSNQEASLSAAEQLANACHIAYSHMILLSVSHSVSEKLARFLLGLSTAPGYSKMAANGVVPVELDLTHDEIAQTIGTARESVSRVLAKFRREHLAILTGSLLLVQNRIGLERIAGMRTDANQATGAAQISRRRRPVSVEGRALASGWAAQ